tara:strand:+ start:2748 stop:3680 length:933 start_codon:yes stop_codon:yes gene_type:complete
MFIISYPNMLLGGYGDRIHGLIAIKILSKVFNHDFYILWDKENIIDLFDYEKYNAKNITNIKEIGSNGWNLIDGGKLRLVDHVKNNIQNEDKPDKDKTYKYIFPNEHYVFHLNSNICRKIGNIVGVNITDEEIINEYQKMYTDIFKPKEFFLKKVDNIIKGRTNIVGIQIRCGDKYMVTNTRETHSTGTYHNIDKYLTAIKKQCDETMDSSYNIFITSDSDEAYKTGIKIWNKDRVIYNDDIIQHLDRKPVDEDISKVFVDSYILSMCTCKLYITYGSNYGMVSALSCIHDNIYGINYAHLSKNKILKNT